MISMTGWDRRALVVAGLSVLLTCACSSSAKQGSTGGVSGNGGASGSGGKGTGGGGGSRAVDAASDLRGDAGTSTPEDPACHNAIQAECQRLVACEYNTADDCEQPAVTCPDFFFNADSTRTIQQITDCFAQFAKVTCTDFDSSEPIPTASAEARGPRAQRVSTAASARAADARDIATGAGRAAPSRWPPANPARRRGAALAIRHRKTQLCTPTSTIAYAGLNQPCNLSALPWWSAAPATCTAIAPTAGTTAGTCRPPLGNGEACAGPGALCEPPLVCYNQTTCQPDPFELCGDAGVCDDASFCKPNGLGFHVCAPRAALGAGLRPRRRHDHHRVRLRHALPGLAGNLRDAWQPRRPVRRRRSLRWAVPHVRRRPLCDVPHLGLSVRPSRRRHRLTASDFQSELPRRIGGRGVPTRAVGTAVLVLE